MRRSKRNDRLDALVAAVTLHVLAGDQAALGVPDDVELLQAGAIADAFDLLGDHRGQIGRSPRVERAEQAAKVKAEHAEAVIP